MNNYIRICDIEKYYGNASHVTKAIDRLTFTVDRGEFMGVMGASGSGKTTLLNLLATIFIMFVTSWLIGYMVRFMLEKRSREFGIYLLLGMKKSTVARLYLRENILSGTVALFLGVMLGTLLKQVLMVILFSLINMTYRLHISLHPGTLLTTAFSFGACYLLSLFRCRKKFKKMNIHDLMEAERKNEEIKESHEPAKRFLLPLSLLFLLLFWALFGSLQSNGATALFLIGLVAAIYLFYTGLSACIICYIRRGGNLVYRGQNLFLLRQFSAKIRTMQFTMGTLTVLFTLALMGSSFALMFSTWQNTLLDNKFPFDILLYSPDPGDTFEREIQFFEKRMTPLDTYSYHIYTDGDNQVNTWMLTHLQAWGAMYQTPDGSPDTAKIEDFLENRNVYYPNDTYMGLTDCNRLRRMLGYEAITLDSTEYAVQIKPRLKEEVQTIGEDLKLAGVSSSADLSSAKDTPAEAPLLSLAGIYADPFSQDGHDGADYLIIVPDEVLSRMRPCHSELAVEIDAVTPPGLRESELHSLIFKQLAAYYLCPALFAILISGKMMLFAGDRFVMATGVPVSAGSFFLKSIALFFGVYLVYFAVTYLCFIKNRFF